MPVAETTPIDPNLSDSMLTKEQSIVEYDFSRQTAVPDRLHQKTHGHYLGIANELIAIYHKRIGETRQAIHQAVRRRLQDVEDCPTRRIAAFCKLLDDASEYLRDESGSAAKLRRRIHALAAPMHPLVQRSDALFDHDEFQAKQSIAAELGIPWEEIEARLFADVIEFHRLKTPPNELDGGGLLSRYNVAQTQSALYGATTMTVWAKDDFKLILRYAKLARLMHSIARQGDDYVFQFNGPASVVRQTKRYGVAYARFLPGLLSTHDWRMKATILGPANHRFAIRLTDRDGLRGEVVSEAFDSELEKMFAASWEETETNGWTLRREGTVLHEGQTVFMPDFTLRHEVHGEVLLEIIGFWTPEYLKEKVVRLERFKDHANILLAIAARIDDAIPDLNIPRVTYKTTLKAKQIVAKLELMLSPCDRRSLG